MNWLPMTKGETHYKAVMFLIILEILTLFTIINYSDFLLKKVMPIACIILFIALVVILSVNILAFSYDNRWETYIDKFDNWPKDRNRKGSWIVVFFILFLVANFIISINLSSLLK